MKIVINNKRADSILRKKSEVVLDVIREHKLIRQLFDINKKNKGVGLAAVQVGELKRIFIVDIKGYRSVFINPEYIKKSKTKNKLNEGCLSEPGIEVEVSRHEEIELSFQDFMGKPLKEKFNGILARIIQHEMDHLEGILLQDYLDES